MNMTKSMIHFPLFIALLFSFYAMAVLAADSNISVKGYASIKGRPMDKDFKVSVLDSFQDVQQLFSEMRQDDRNHTQCFNRAHWWCYTMERDHGVKSMKIFLLFTKRFRKTLDPKWDFHVAPMVASYNEHGEIQEYVLDQTFMNNPLRREEWVRNFSEGKPCIEASTFPEGYAKDEQNWCYIIRVPMYYLALNEIRKTDTGSKPAAIQWNKWELKKAEEAFGAHPILRRFGILFNGIL
ncbi:MAG: hypothetical protein HQK53_13395 [Oligoflexia bacterium]|nr:hypothetical protein [Oligoflexia bacterium]